MTILSKPLPHINRKIRASFQKRVDKTPGLGPTGECWAWTGEQTPQGYGRMKVQVHGQTVSQVSWRSMVRTIRATHVAYFLRYKVDPAPFLLRQTCRWPPCVRWDHLEQATHPWTTLDKGAK